MHNNTANSTDNGTLETVPFSSIDEEILSFMLSLISCVVKKLPTTFHREEKSSSKTNNKIYLEIQ